MLQFVTEDLLPKQCLPLLEVRCTLATIHRIVHIVDYKLFVENRGKAEMFVQRSNLFILKYNVALKLLVTIEARSPSVITVNLGLALDGLRGLLRITSLVTLHF
jgi:hypothetical protein